MAIYTDGPLATRDLLVLAVLADEPLHGYGLVKAVEQRSQGSTLIDPANLYRLLRRMNDAGWIDEMATKGYSRRRTYQITSVGRSVLRTETERMAVLLERLSPAKSSG